MIVYGNQVRVSIMNKPYRKQKNGTYLYNCILRRRKNDPASWLLKINRKKGEMLIALNGYAIIPLEDYMKFKGITDDKIKKITDKIENADEEIHCTFNFSDTLNGFLEILKNFGNRSGEKK